MTGIRAWFHAVPVHGMDFSGITFDDFEAEGTRFKRCDFSRARIEGSFGVRRQTVFEECRFERARLRDVQPGQARFVGCTFIDVDLSGWSAVANEFVDCSFSGTLRRCKFWGRPWGGWLERGDLRGRRVVNEFRGNDFSRAELEDVGFAGGIDLDQQRLPEGPQYIRLRNAQARIERARPLVATWQPAEDREEAEILLDAYTDDEIEEQYELFANRWETGTPRAVATRLWKLLEGMDVE